MYIYIYMYVCMYICIKTFIYLFIHLCVYIYIHTCVYIYICRYVQVAFWVMGTTRFLQGLHNKLVAYYGYRPVYTGIKGAYGTVPHHIGDGRPGFYLQRDTTSSCLVGFLQHKTI